MCRTGRDLLTFKQLPYYTVALLDSQSPKGELGQQSHFSVQPATPCEVVGSRMFRYHHGDLGDVDEEEPILLNRVAAHWRLPTFLSWSALFVHTVESCH